MNISPNNQIIDEISSLLLTRYLVIEKYNKEMKGSFGNVFFVYEKGFPMMKYAVKVQPIHKPGTTNQIDSLLLQACKEEAYKMRLLRHDRVAAVHSDYSIKQYHFIQMQQFRDSLEGWRQNNTQQISHKQFCKFALEILEGLEYIHSQSYVLRDLKLQNILLDEKGHLKFCDFGAVKNYPIVEQHSFDSCYGSLCYLPPEALHKILVKKSNLVRQTSKGDIWAVGVCLAILGNADVLNFLTSYQEGWKIPNSPLLNDSSKQIVQFILKQKPNERPSIPEIRALIEKSKQNLPIYANRIVPMSYLPQILQPSRQQEINIEEKKNENAGIADEKEKNKSPALIEFSFQGIAVEFFMGYSNALDEKEKIFFYCVAVMRLVLLSSSFIIYFFFLSNGKVNQNNALIAMITIQIFCEALFLTFHSKLKLTEFSYPLLELYSLIFTSSIFQCLTSDDSVVFCVLYAIYYSLKNIDLYNFNIRNRQYSNKQVMCIFLMFYSLLLSIPLALSQSIVQKFCLMVSIILSLFWYVFAQPEQTPKEKCFQEYQQFMNRIIIIISNISLLFAFIIDIQDKTELTAALIFYPHVSCFTAFAHWQVCNWRKQELNHGKERKFFYYFHILSLNVMLPMFLVDNSEEVNGILYAKIMIWLFQLIYPILTEQKQIFLGLSFFIEIASNINLIILTTILFHHYVVEDFNFQKVFFGIQLTLEISSLIGSIYFLKKYLFHNN